MLTVLSRNWWVVVLRGALAVLFGIAALLWPQLTLRVLVVVFGVYALADGLFEVVTAFSDRKTFDGWWLFLVEGLVTVAAGVVAILWPAITALVLLYVIAAWAIITGLFKVVAALRLRREIEGEWLLVVSGLLSVVFGILIAFQPGAGALALVWLIGAYAILFGVLVIALGFRLRGWRGPATGLTYKTR